MTSLASAPQQPFAIRLIPWGFAQTGSIAKPLSETEVDATIAAWVSACETGDRPSAWRALDVLAHGGWFRAPGAKEPGMRAGATPAGATPPHPQPSSTSIPTPISSPLAAPAASRVEPGAATSPMGDAGTCRSCGAAILWSRTASGKAAPFNPDGTSHFATCPNAAEHRKPKAPIESGAALPEWRFRDSDRDELKRLVRDAGLGSDGPQPEANIEAQRALVREITGGREIEQLEELTKMEFLALKARLAAMAEARHTPTVFTAPTPSTSATAGNVINIPQPTSCNALQVIVPPVAPPVAPPPVAEAPPKRRGRPRKNPSAPESSSTGSARAEPSPPSGSIELRRDAWALCYVTLPATEPPTEIAAHMAAIPRPTDGRLVLDEIGAAWAGATLGALDDVSERISAQRKRLHQAIDAAADRAALRVAAARAPFAETYEPALRAFTEYNLRGKRRSIDLMSVRLALRTIPASIRRNENPGEEAALVEWVEEHLGFEFIERRPRVAWAATKKRLEEMSPRSGEGPLAGRLTVEVVDQETGAVDRCPVPGCEMTAEGEAFSVKATAPALAAPAAPEDSNENEEE